MEATNLISAIAKVVDAKKSTDKTYANALLYHAGSVRNTCNTLGYGGTTHSGGCVYGVVSPFPV